MKLLVNEAFQFRGIHREGSTLTVSSDFLEKEIKRGRKENKNKVDRASWLSGLMEFCTPANQETSDFIKKLTGKDSEPENKKEDEIDDSEEILDIRGQFNDIGKAYDKRWRLKRLRNELLKAKKEVGEERKEMDQKQETLNESIG